MLRIGLEVLCILALSAQALASASQRAGHAHNAENAVHAQQSSIIDRLEQNVPPNSVYTQILYSVHDSECTEPVQTNSYFLGICAPKDGSDDFVIHTCENAVLKEQVFSDAGCQEFLFERVSFLTQGCTPAFEKVRRAGDGALSFSACISPFNQVVDNGNGTINSTCGIIPSLTANQGCSAGQAHLRVLSAGFNDGNAGAALLNGQDISGADRGWHAICLEKDALTVKAEDKFDLVSDPERNDAFLSFLLDECQSGDVLVLYVVDDGLTNLSDDVKETLWVLYGATDLAKLQFRDSYILVSRKSQDGSKCSLNADGFFEERTCDVHPPNELFDSPAEVTRYTDSQCGQAYVQSVWPVNTCTGGSETSTIARCVDDGTLLTTYDDSVCDVETSEQVLSTDGCSFLSNNIAYTSTCGAVTAAAVPVKPAQTFVTDFRFYIERVFTAHDTQCEDPVQVDAWYLGVCAPGSEEDRSYQLGCTNDGVLRNFTYEGEGCLEENLISVIILNKNDSGNGTINGTVNGTLPSCDPDAFGFLRVGTCTNNNSVGFDAAALTLFPQSNCSTPYFRTSVEEETCIASLQNTAYEAVCANNELNILLGTASEVCSTPPIAEEVVAFKTGDCFPVEGDEAWPLRIDATGWYTATCGSEEPGNGFKTDTSLYIQYVFDPDDDDCEDDPVAANIWHLGVCTPSSTGELVQYGCVDGVLSKYTYDADSECADNALQSVEVVTETGEDDQCVLVNDAYRITQACTDKLDNFESETSIALYGGECDTEPYFETIHKEGECVPVRNGLYLTTSCSNNNQELSIYTAQPSGSDCRRGFRAATADLNECDSIPNQVGQFLAYDDPVGNWFATCARDELPGVEVSGNEEAGGSRDAAPTTRAGFSWLGAATVATMMLLFARP